MRKLAIASFFPGDGLSTLTSQPLNGMAKMGSLRESLRPVWLMIPDPYVQQAWGGFSANTLHP